MFGERVMMIFFLRKERAMMLLHYLYKCNCIHRHRIWEEKVLLTFFHFYFLIFKVGDCHSIKHAIKFKIHLDRSQLFFFVFEKKSTGYY